MPEPIFTSSDRQAKERIDAYLVETGLAGRARVVPLTGDASDRKYFRVIPSDGASHVVGGECDCADPVDHDGTSGYEIDLKE